MPEKTFLLRLRGGASQIVVATSFEIQEGHLVFLGPGGELAAMLMLAIVESWREMAPEPFPP